MSPAIRAADESTVRLLDGMVICWLVLWLLVGVLTGYATWQLSGLGDTVASSGEALDSTGSALQALEAVPVVGERTSELGGQVAETADEVSASGVDLTSRLQVLSVLLGLSIVTIPTTPVLGLYAPLRWARRREVADLRRALANEAESPRLERHLAMRALTTMPYAEVSRISADPWHDIAAGNTRALAAAEMRRLGLQPPDRPR